ncbi:MAG: FliI/YscN family ATPase [bacterium]|nr:FliI/YscN family ATPase [bacterium]
MDIWNRAESVVKNTNLVASRGEVVELRGLIIEGNGPAAGVGTTCSIIQGETRVPAQVVGFRKDRILLMPYGELYGIAPGAGILAQTHSSTMLVNEELLGRVLDPFLQPLDGLSPVRNGTEVPLYASPPGPMQRERIADDWDTGIKAVNSMLTVGKGQRVAIMAGSGVGKSTFLGMIAKHSRSTVNVIALVGERGREVREFIERDLGPEGMARSVVIVATSDSSPLLRIRAAFAATAIAEYFRDRGEDVALMVDSITRFCMAQREIGLAVGEPPSAAGYTPSVFALLPKLLERAGTKIGAGSITGFYTVLVEGDDMNEPIADAVRGILDGHIVLSRKLAGRGHYPAIDILQSVSRVMSEVSPSERLSRSYLARKVLADYAEAEDLVSIGAYQQGTNPRIDFAISHIEKLREYLRQSPEEFYAMADCDQQMGEIFSTEV